MPLEVEQKFRVEDLDAVRGRLGEFESHGVCTEHDTYFAHPARDFAVTDEALRLRTLARDGRPPTHVLTYKGPKRPGPVKTRLEEETPVADRAAFASILGRLGFRPVADVRKRRETFAAGGVTVTLDEVEDAGRFVEVETVVEDAAGGERAVLDAAARIGLADAPVERRSYLSLVLGSRAA